MAAPHGSHVPFAGGTRTQSPRVGPLALALAAAASNARARSPPLATATPLQPCVPAAGRNVIPCATARRCRRPIPWVRCTCCAMIACARVLARKSTTTHHTTEPPTTTDPLCTRCGCEIRTCSQAHNYVRASERRAGWLAAAAAQTTDGRRTANLNDICVHTR